MESAPFEKTPCRVFFCCRLPRAGAAGVPARRASGTAGNRGGDSSCRESGVRRAVDRPARLPGRALFCGRRGTSCRSGPVPGCLFILPYAALFFFAGTASYRAGRFFCRERASGPLRFRAARLPPSVLSFYRPGSGYCRIRGGIVELFHTRCGNIPQIFIYIWPEFGRYFAVNKCFNGNIAVLAQGLNPLSMPSTIIRAL